ncbi:flagellar basal-body rod protein FlgF/flagellar basal-body rod protein FlgG [Fodinibius roseus]|uniref:Flagellar basal-body rod protein FlgF/flagellar basal-body rod protein FlgG n=2 Tax=Fodinibius roseus TaxID=1194090 RepID=A0A1M5HDW7_9BACT|nr:flagellar basal-body rod protein FlgF/flagellar basal-body rod protein FlgG [Fodinibius roseus]
MRYELTMLERLEAQMQAMQMLSKTQEVTADNLANINTPGFKGNKVFYQMVKEQVDGREVSRTIPRQHLDMSQGVLEATNNEFDFAIKGEGFFMVEGQNGERQLTRDGRFHIDPDGFLVDGNGSKVIGNGGPINMPDLIRATEANNGGGGMEVATDGTIRINDEVYDQIRTVGVEDPSQLERQGSNYFKATEEMLTEDHSSSIMQGYFEKGNVNPLNEMVDMMQTVKTFESQQRAIRTTDEMLGQATSKLGQF